MRFLIIRLSSIGDIVLTTPVIRCLHKQLPGVEIHFLVKKNFSSILNSNPYVNKVHIWKDEISETLADLKAENFDVVIDLHHNLRSLKIKSGLGLKSFSFYKLNVEKWLMTALKWNRLPDRHIVDRYLDTVSSFGVNNDGAGLDFFIPMEDEVIPADISDTLNREYVAMVIGAAHYTKRLPAEKLSELLQKIPFPVVLIGGPEDRALGEMLVKGRENQVVNSCGHLNLNQSASLVRQASLVITHDTGMMHIAAAFHRPIISVWGNTIPAFGMSAYYGEIGGVDFRAEVQGLSCRPCSKIGYSKCPRKHFRCMIDQDIHGIAIKVREVLQQPT